MCILTDRMQKKHYDIVRKQMNVLLAPQIIKSAILSWGFLVVIARKTMGGFGFEWIREL